MMRAVTTRCLSTRFLLPDQARRIPQAKRRSGDCNQPARPQNATSSKSGHRVLVK